MEITIEIKSNYGKEAIYPICEKGLIFASMLGQKTLTRCDIEKIKALGFGVQVKQIIL